MHTNRQRKSETEADRETTVVKREKDADRQ